MDATRRKWDSTVQKLRQERDELGVRMHLAKAELRDEWQVLEKRWAQFEARIKAADDPGRDATQRTFDTPLGALAGELGKAFRRFRRRSHR